MPALSGLYGEKGYNMEKLAKMMSITKSIAEITNPLPEDMYMPIMCMLIDEYARNNEKDAIKIASLIHEAVGTINETFGAYR